LSDGSSFKGNFSAVARGVGARSVRWPMILRAGLIGT